MCYFIHLTITPQGKTAQAEAVAYQIAAQHKLYLRGEYPAGLAVTEGHCSCSLVTPHGMKSSVTDFLRDLVYADAIKNIRVGWLFGDEMPSDAVLERLSIDDFLERNEASQLSEAVWYRLNALEKYIP